MVNLKHYGEKYKIKTGKIRILRPGKHNQEIMSGPSLCYGCVGLDYTKNVCL